ncbi:MAG: BspA family leucine-rich repeat surface protein [Bacilli bacterium]|nr:BspA family leucine-rich repeat surface protein [Bacilli bacterium]
MKKGFTLIELLAVIVILAVIALIAVPSIMGIITKAKRGAAESSAYNYIKAVENQIVINQINSQEKNIYEGSYSIGQLKYYYDVKLKGTNPSFGTISISNEGKVNNGTFCINNYNITYDGTHAKIIDDNCSSLIQTNFLLSGDEISLSDFESNGDLIKINFVNYINDEAIIGKFEDERTNSFEDLSLNQDLSIIGWTEESIENPGYYELFIGSENKIYANKNSSSLFSYLRNVEEISFANFDTSKVIYMSGMFNNMQNLTSLDLSNFDTSNVNSMSYMFFGVSSLTSLDLSSFDTSNVTDMSLMFFEMDSLTNLDLSSFDTSKVINMRGMFANMQNLMSLDLSSFNTSNVTNVEEMFCNTPKLTNLDISHFDTSKMMNLELMNTCIEA